MTDETPGPAPGGRGGGRPRYLEAAAAHLDRAVAADDAREAIRALEMVGRWLLQGGGPDVLVVTSGAPQAAGEGAEPERADVAVLPAAFVAELAAHPGLVARAARSLGMFAEMDGAEALPAVLYARSGYQSLVDAKVWPGHPVRLEHLRESDEEILDAVVDVGVADPDLPARVPASHAWWPKRSSGPA